MMFRSIDVYEEAYDEAYGKGLYLKDEVEDMLYQSNLYSFFDDQELEKLKKDIEELKIEAFQSFRRPKIFKELNIKLELLKKKWQRFHARNINMII